MVRTEVIELSTQGNTEVTDITSDVVKAITECGIQNGLVTVFSPSATSGLTTIEFEPGCVNDLKRLFEEIIPKDRDYQHNLKWGDGNGHSHIRAALLKASISIPFVQGKLTLGTWQQIIFIDFDTRSRQRKLVVQMIGE